jgi:hypothetical protein
MHRENAKRIGLVIGLVLLAGWLLYMAAGPTGVAKAEPGEVWANAAEQRQAMIKAQQETNRKLDEIIRLLTSGKARVQTVTVEPPKASGGSHEVTTQPHGM